MSREQMLARQNEILALAHEEHRAMTDEERAEFDTLQRALEALAAAIPSPEAAGHANQRSQTDNGDDDDDSAGDGERDFSEVQQRAAEDERARIRAIEDMCGHFGLDARAYVDNGMSSAAR